MVIAAFKVPKVKSGSDIPQYMVRMRILPKNYVYYFVKFTIAICQKSL